MTTASKQKPSKSIKIGLIIFPENEAQSSFNNTSKLIYEWIKKSATAKEKINSTKEVTFIYNFQSLLINKRKKSKRKRKQNQT